MLSRFRATQDASRVVNLREAMRAADDADPNAATHAGLGRRGKPKAAMDEDIYATPLPPETPSSLHNAIVALQNEVVIREGDKAKADSALEDARQRLIEAQQRWVEVSLSLGIKAEVPNT